MLDSVFSESVLTNGENSEIIELSDNNAIVLRIHERIPAKLKAQDSVITEIRSRLTQRNNLESVMKAANAAKSKILAGSTIKDALPKGIKIVRKSTVKRQDVNEVNPKILETGFKMTLSDARENSVEIVSGLSDGVALVVLDKINTADTQDKTLLASNKNAIAGVYANNDFNAVLASITSKAKIVRNRKVLEQ